MKHGSFHFIKQHMHIVLKIQRNRKAYNEKQESSPHPFPYSVPFPRGNPISAQLFLFSKRLLTYLQIMFIPPFLDLWIIDNILRALAMRDENLVPSDHLLLPSIVYSVFLLPYIYTVRSMFLFYSWRFLPYTGFFLNIPGFLAHLSLFLLMEVQWITCLMSDNHWSTILVWKNKSPKCLGLKYLFSPFLSTQTNKRQQPG